jgi:hypothetical protein
MRTSRAILIRLLDPSGLDPAGSEPFKANPVLACHVNGHNDPLENLVGGLILTAPVTIPAVLEGAGLLASEAGMALGAAGAAFEAVSGYANAAIQAANTAIAPYAPGIVKFVGDVADGLMPGSPGKYNYTTTITNLGSWNYKYYGDKR